MAEILRVEGLIKHYTGRGLWGRHNITKAVDGVSFSIYDNDVLVLAGESGSGKSTIARLILGAAGAHSGKIFLDGEKVEGKAGIKKIRAHCQIVHQDPYDSINPRMQVNDIIKEPLEIHHTGNAASRKEKIVKALADVRLDYDEVAKMHPHELSGGQRQRVVLARALVLKPRIIIADEPVSMLDVSIRAEMLGLLDELRRNHKISFIYITHDLATARHFGKRIAVMYKGRLVEIGPIDEVISHPMHPYTQALLDAVCTPDPKNLTGVRQVRINEPTDKKTGCAFRARCPYAIEKCAQEPPLERINGREVSCFAAL